MTRVALENWWAWGFGLPLAIAVVIVCGWSHWRQGRGVQEIAALVGPRLVAFLVLLFLASRPVRINSEAELPKRDRVALLIDRSESMSLEDEQESRYRQAVRFLRGELLPALDAADLSVEPLLFAEDVRAARGTQIAGATPDGKGTNLARAIARTLTQAERPPLAIITLTDGVTTVNTDNARAITTLVDNRVPLIGIGFGGEFGTRVLSLEHVVAPPVASPHQEFRISARLRATGAAELPRFDLTLLCDGKLAQQKTITSGPGARVWQESFQVTEPEEGFHSYTIQLLPPADPAVKCVNMEETVAVRIAGEEQLRVLFVQGGLTWDYKFIRLALAADPTLKLSGLSRVSSQSKFLQSMEDADDLVSGFPSTLDELASFRVVALSSVKSGDLTPAQQELLAQFCRDLGGGVLMIGGASTFDASWQDSRLEQLLPVRFSPYSRRPSGGQPFRLRVTDEALAHPVFQISNTGDNRTTWSRLPTFTHFAAVDSVKPGAWIWAVHPSSGRSATGPVLMASQRYGAGLSAVICVQNFWRWRLAKGSNPQHFDRFWQQLFRHLGEGSRDAVALRLPDQRLEPGADIRLIVERRPDPRGARTGREDYRLRVTDDENQSVTDQTIELGAGQSAEVTFSVKEPGLFKASVVDRQGLVVASRSLDIRSINREFLHTARNMETLRQWAALSDGIAMRFEDCDDTGRLIDEIKSRGEQPRRPSAGRRPLGINGWILGTLLGCLCAEWLLRKRWGLI